VTPEVYGQLVAQYRSGRFVETARRVGSRVPMELRRAQRGFFDRLPPADDVEGFRDRLAAALMHAETVAHFGWNHAIWVLREPVDDLPRNWVRGLPDHFREEAVAAWGDGGASDLRKLLWREIVLSAARNRLARMDLASASRILEEAEPRRDAALGWQLAVVWSVRARYVRENALWRDARELFREAARSDLVSRATALNSPRTVARALGDRDDRNLRLALVALGQGRTGRAADRLRDVGEHPPHQLRVPRLMLLGETRIAEERLDPAIAGFREAVELAPNSHAVVAALVAALEARGRWDEAAELATEQMAVPRGNRVWTDFLISWAKSAEPALDWLHDLVSA
jgi:tetratricopeptide (TPR) repeat protein